MRRWAWRTSLAAVVLLLVVVGAFGVRAFERACDGSLEGLRYLSNVRNQIATATAPPPKPPPSSPAPTASTSPGQSAPAQPTPAPPLPPSPEPPLWQPVLDLAGAAGDAALVAVILLKQHDAVAYPAHIAAAHTLETAGCRRDAVRLQWLKAGLHASTDGEVAYIASSLIEAARGPDDLADLRTVVRTWTERAPLSVSLRRVLTALDASAS